MLVFFTTEYSIPRFHVGGLLLIFFFFGLFLYSLYVSPSQSFYFAFELEVLFDFLVVEDGEAVDDGDGVGGPFDDVSGVEVEVGGVGDGEDEGIDIVEGGG